MPSRVVAVNLTADPTGFIAGFGKAGVAAEALDAKTKALHKNLGTLGGAFVGYEIVKGLGDATKAAANFQTQILRLKTDANESGKNLALVSKGVLDLAGATANSTSALTGGLYKIESAGIHGADALKVLKAAAEGAKVGQADLTTVSDALTTAMVDYKLPATAAVATTNQLIATVSRGKTTLEDLSGALSRVLPNSATAKVGLDQVLGAMATMTAQGTPAAVAATYLRQTIVALSNPLPKAQAELKGLGLSSLDVSNNLGKRGLTGTLGVLTDAINSKLGPSGIVALQAFTKTTGSTKDLASALGALPQKQQTVVASLADLVGGSKQLQGILQLTQLTAGKLVVNPSFIANVKGVADGAKGAGNDVKDWSDVQKTLNFQLAAASGALEKVTITLGQELLPPVTHIVKKFAEFAGVLGKHPKLVEGVTYAFVGAGSLLVGLKLVNGAFSILQTTMANSLKLRGINTATMVAEGAAAKAAAVNVAALDLAESRVGLRAPIGGALGRLGLAGAATTGGETAAIGAGTASLTVGSIAVAGAITIAGAAAFGGALYVAGKSMNSDGSGFAQGNGRNGAPTPGESRTLQEQYAHAAGYNLDGTPYTGQAAFTGTVGMVNTTQGRNGDKNSRTQNAGLFAGVSTAAKAASSGLALAAFKAGIMQAAFEKAGDGASGLALGLAHLSDNAITASRAQDGFQQQLNDLALSIDKGSKSLVGNGNAAIQNRGLLDELAQANEQAAEAVYKHTGSIDKARSTLIANATALEKNAAQAFGSKKAADDFLKSIGALPSQVAAAFAGLHDIGLKVGTDLGAGLVAGITAQVGPVNVAGKLLVDSTAKQMRLAAQTQSPSKVTHKIGVDFGKGFHHGLSSQDKAAAAAAKHTAEVATAALKFQVKTATAESVKSYEAGIAVLKKKISGAQSALSTLRGDRSSAMSSAKGNITGVADLSAIVGTTTVTDNWDGSTTKTNNPVTGGQVKAGLDADAALAVAFVRHLKQLRDAKYSKKLTDQILEMGPVAGDAYAVAILSLGAGGVAGINADFSTINQAGNAAAAAAGAPYQAGIDKQVKATEALTKALQHDQKIEVTLKADAHALSAPNINDAAITAIANKVATIIGRQVNLRTRTSPAAGAGNGGSGFGSIG